MEATVSQDPSQDSNSSGDFALHVNDVSAYERSYWISHSIVVAIAFLLNLVMSIVLARSTLIRKSFYSLMLIFNIVAVKFQAIIIVDIIVSHTDLDELKILIIRILANCVEIISWYFTSTLVFLLGLNRLAILTAGPISTFFAERRNVLWFSFILFGFSVFAGIIASGVLSSLSELLGYDILSDFILRILEAFSPVDLFFAALPLCSCLFYIVAFKKIRSIRRSSLGFEVPDKFEKSILKQGFLICIFYTIPEMTLVISQYGIDAHGGFYLLSQLIFYASLNLPPIGFPLIVFICSKEFRKLFLVNCSKLLHHTQTINTSSTTRVFVLRSLK
ncbi:hypothetical protein V3C99_007200 [Haemonchus contortus]